MTNESLHPNAVYMFKFLSQAINELVTGPGDARDRVYCAGEHFLLIAIEAIPSDLQKDATKIREYLTEFKAEPGAIFPFDTDLRVTMKRRRKSTATKIAQSMWSLYNRYLWSLESNRESRAV